MHRKVSEEQEDLEALRARGYQAIKDAALELRRYKKRIKGEWSHIMR